MEIYDRPSLRYRKKLGEARLQDINTVLKKRWVKPLNGKGSYIPLLKVLLHDKREVWIQGLYHVRGNTTS